MREHETDPAGEVRQLSADLREYQKTYYVDGRPLVSDLEYDRLFDRLSALEREHPELRFPDSPTVRVGSDLSSDFPAVRHTVPVLSLDKAYSDEAVLAWIEKSQQKMGQQLSFVVEQKIDGLSIVLYYERGVLDRAVTRGNGTVGNDVTANVKTIASIPLRLPEPATLAVRGEIYLPKADFTKLNSKLEVPFANPRNLAAGTLRRIKSSEVAKVPLRIFVYEGFWADGRSFDDHLAILSTLKRYGFTINPTFGLFCRTAEEASLLLGAVGLSASSGTFADIRTFIERQTEGREKLPYEIDGLVVKINELEVRRQFGYTEHHPRWAVAYKFESPQAQTTVQGIDVQVGRTGRITPVARVKPVAIGGSVVSNVTLHNQDYIDMLELAVGDTVEISKRGDVIPAVERVIEKNEDGNGTWVMPESCPCCGTPLVRRGAHTFCPNVSCPDQIRGRVEFFIGKGQMDIETFGPETASALLEKGALKDIDDIYTIDYRTVLADEPGFGEKKIRAIVDGVEKSRNRPFSTVLVSLGLPEFGKKAAQMLIKSGIRSMDELLSIADGGRTEPLVSIPQIGEKTAALLIDSLNDPAMRRRIAALKEAGFDLTEPEGSSETVPQTFAGQVWCVTGSFEHFNPRSLAVAEIEKRGGRSVTSVTGKTTHLLAGPGGGGKLAKARELGVEIVDEDAFLRMLVSGEAEKEGGGQGEFAF